MEREDFIKLMGDLAASDDATRRINAAIGQDAVLRGCSDFFDASCFTMAGRPIIDRLLAELFSDEDGWIQYWAYELDYGRAWHPGCVTDVDGEDVPLRDAGELYDFLAELLAGVKRPEITDGGSE